jgi:uncharacterized membrane protein YphA (DoxX/SURF4 family)
MLIGRVLLSTGFVQEGPERIFDVPGFAVSLTRFGFAFPFAVAWIGWFAAAFGGIGLLSGFKTRYCGGSSHLVYLQPPGRPPISSGPPCLQHI